MKKLTTRTWVLFAILLALISLYGVVRVHNSHFDSRAEQSIREVSAEQDVAWIIEGVASSTTCNLNGYRMSRGAIAEGAKQLASYTTVFLNHDHSVPIGKIIKAEGVVDYIFVKIEISKSQPKLWKMIRSGVVRSFSIGSVILEESFDWCDHFGDQIKVVDRAYVIEVSVVFIPADPDARITAWYVEPR